MTLLTSVLLMLLGACSRGLKIEVCTINGQGGYLRCNRAGIEYERSTSDSYQWPCIDPESFFDYLAACKNRQALPVINPCKIDRSKLICKDKILDIKEANNWSCLNPFDYRKVVRYCER